MSKEVICECGEKIPAWYLKQKYEKEYEAMMKSSTEGENQVVAIMACCQCWDGEDQEVDSGFCRCGGCGMC